MYAWWSNRSLKTKLQLGIQPVLLIVMFSLQHAALDRFEHDTLKSAKKEAAVSADGVINGLNMLMINGIISNPEQRKLYIKKMGSSEGVLSLRVIRNKPVQDQFGAGLPEEQPVDEMDRGVLQSGKAQSSLSMQDGKHALRVVVPFIARKEFRGTNCLMCHTVPEGAVNGAASITLDMDKAYAEIQRATYVAWSVLIAVQALLFLMLSWLIGFVVRPARVLQQELNRLGAGDFTGHVHVQGGDEIGMLAKSVQKVNFDLGQLIGDVKLSARRLAKTGQRVSMVSRMTSEGVKSQKEETMLASETVMQIAQSLDEAVVASKNAVAVADTITSRASDAKQVIKQTIASIHALAEEVNSSAGLIQELEQESNDIRNVTKMISDIANQTNLLALNAAIEAARAGEGGRGFAVVADEVRKLAQRTQEATIEISQKIEALQAGVKNATQGMSKGRERAEDSVIQIDRTNASLEQIIQSIATVHQANAKIAQSVEVQSRMTTKINETIVNISNVADQTAFSSKKMAVEISKVSDAATVLNSLVENFKVPLTGTEDEIADEDMPGADDFANNALF